MNTAAPARDYITAADDIRSRDFVRELTTYAMHASPERIAQMMRQAYGDLVPGSVVRQRAVEADVSRRPRDTEPVRRRLADRRARRRRSRLRARRRGSARPLRGLVRATCAYERCGKPFEWQWPVTGQRFCSPRCRRGADRLRVMARQPNGDAVAIGQECFAALAQLRATTARTQRLEGGL